MKTRTVLASNLLLSLFALVNVARAANESFTDQFLGSPLLALVAIAIIDVIAFVYHKIRK
ncbi:MAG TPA: hypothetical protein VIH48_00080 [Candidatus Bathyarchaeia archaeon]